MELVELTEYYNRFKFGEDIFHHLMPNRIKEILLISSVFDAYVLEQDSRIAEQISGEYRQLDLMMAPRIITIPFTENINEVLNRKKFDAIVIMMRVGSETPKSLCERIRIEHADIPILLLLNKRSYVEIVEKDPTKLSTFNDVFLWNGDAKLFLALIKSEEDKLNVENDTKIGDVRVILLIESSIDYYSTFLPLIYSVSLQLTQEAISTDVEDINKRLKTRGRPKILMAHNYEDANELYEKYKNNLLCVISNSHLKVNNEQIEDSGIELLQKIRKENPALPLLLQSADERKIKIAEKIDTMFLYKYSETLFNDLKTFIQGNLGFGDFIFRDKNGNEIDRAISIYHFEKKLEKISEDSIKYHLRNNHFSSWLLAHGQIKVAKKIKQDYGNDSISMKEIREYLLSTIRKVRQQQNRGKVIKFSPDIFYEEDKIIQLADGSMGGKGRGLAFLNALLVSMELHKQFDNVNIKLPRTAIIGTSEFDKFIFANHINADNIAEMSDFEIDTLFLQGKLSKNLIKKLETLIENVTVPLAIRSSGLLEDSQSQPFAGIYRTFMIPNIHPDKKVRLKQLCDAIKLVLASPFMQDAKKYIESINFKIEEEKMAVVIQEIVGNKDHEDYFYPQFSGAAQSYNFYPSGNMKHSDGIAALAAGLGKAVVDGERAFRYCPKHPRVNLLEPTGIVENNQRDFYGLDLSMQDDIDLKCEETFVKKRRIRSSHKQNVFKEITSVWDYQNLQFLDGAYIEGPRMLTYRNLIYYNKFPLSGILLKILEIGEIATGVPVEIEFAINLSNDIPTFYLLQIRPLSVNKENINIKIEEIDRDEMVLFSTKAMGNGKIENIRDIVFIDPASFDNTKTMKIAEEVSQINSILEEKDRNYILLGPGRWGTSDRFLGVPVRWAQINKAKIIVEASQENFTVEASQGSHFFHNLVAMNVGYFTISHSSDNDFINWKWLKSLPSKQIGAFTNHIELNKNMEIQIDGKKGIALISHNQNV